MLKNIILSFLLLAVFFPSLSFGDLTIGNFADRFKTIGSYKNNAVIQFSIDKSQIKDTGVLKIQYQNNNGGYSGIYMPLNQNWNEATGLKMVCRGTPGKLLQITLVDAKNRHFIYDVLFADDKWDVKEITLDNFSLNPYFQPKEATDLKSGIVLDEIKQIQFSPSQPGTGTFYISQIIVQGVTERKKMREQPADKQGAFIFFNRRIDYTKLEKYLPYCEPLQLSSETQVTAGTWQGFKFLNASVYLLADSHNLYLVAQVRQTDSFYNNKSKGDIWNGDCIELFLGFGKEVKHRYGPKDFQIGISPGKGNIAPSAWVFNLGKPLKDPKMVVERNESGYTLKAQIAVKELGIPALTDGQPLYLDVAVDKAGTDGNRMIQLTWHGNGLGYMNPTQWHYALISSNRDEAMEMLNQAIKKRWQKKQNAVLVVDGQKSWGAINPLLYGINVFPERGTPAGWMDYSPEAVAKYKGASLTLLRFPGGDWGDEHKLEPSHLKAFIGLCKHLKAEPMVQIKLHKGTAKEAADLVRYCNKTKRYNIKYWAIGNEPDFFEPRHFPNRKYRTDDYIRDFKAMARAMRKVDPAIKLCGPELSQYQYFANQPDSPRDKNGKSWMETFLKECGNEVDIVTFHHYPMGGVNGIADWRTEALLETTNRWEDILPGLKKEIFKLTKRHIPIGITEINSDWSGLFNGEATADTFANAVWWTVTLGEFMRYKIDVVCFFALYNTGAYGIVTKELGTLPAYYTYKLFRNFGRQLIFAESDNEHLKVYASKMSGNAFSVIVVNKNLKLNIRTNMTFRNMGRIKKVAIRKYSEYEYLNNQDFSLNQMQFNKEINYLFPSYSITQFILEP